MTTRAAQATDKLCWIIPRLLPSWNPTDYLLGRVLGEDPVTNAEVLFDEIREIGYTGDPSVLKEVPPTLPEGAREKEDDDPLGDPPAK